MNQIKVSPNVSINGLIEGTVYDAEKHGHVYYVEVPGNGKVTMPEEYIIEVATNPWDLGTPVSQAVSAAEEQALKMARGSALKTSAPSTEKSDMGILEKILSEEKATFKAVESTTKEAAAPKQDNKEKEEALQKIRNKLIPHASPRLKDRQFWLTDLTEGRLPESGMDHIITCYGPNHFPENMRDDIPEFDMFYDWNPDVLEMIHLSHETGEKLLAVGYPGSGKSTGVEQYSAAIDQPFMALNGKSGIDASSFLGFLWASANGTEFAEGLLPVAMRNGYSMCIDEVFKIPPEIQMNFQTVYQESGCLLLDEKPGTLSDKLVKPHSEFRLYATDNAKGTGDNFEKFGATQVQDTSTLDRFGLTVDVPYLPQEREELVLQRMFPDIPKKTIARFVLVANMVRESYTKSDVALTLSMRGLKVMCKLYLKGINEQVCFKRAYMEKLGEEEEINTALSFGETVGLSAEVPVISPTQAAKATADAAGDDEVVLPWENV